MIRIDKPVTLLLPFDSYRLTLSHRLLDSLGGVSRFLLGAIEQNLSLSALNEITGLSQSVLLNQLAFLQSHRYIEALEGEEAPILSLTHRGTAMMQVQRLLEDFELTVWLDAFTLRRHAVHLALFPQPLSTIVNATETEEQERIVAQLPRRRKGRSGHLHLFDEANRLRVLLDKGALRLLLEHSWGQDCALITDESEHWECELQAPATEKEAAHLPVCFAPGQLALSSLNRTEQGVTPVLPFVSLPVLEINHVFKPVANFPWPTIVPPAETHNLELVSATALPDSIRLTSADEAADSYLAMPISLGTDVPGSVPQPIVPPGVSCEISLKKLQGLFTMDEEQLSQHMRNHPEALVISHNLLSITEKQSV